MQKLIEQINEQIALFTENAKAQVEKNNKAAGTRARKAALELSKLMKDFRKRLRNNRFIRYFLPKKPALTGRLLLLRGVFFYKRVTPSSATA